MGFKRIKYNSGEGIARIRMEDETGAMVENWTVMWSDLDKWLKVMERKYSISLKNKSKDRDIDWLR